MVFSALLTPLLSIWCSSPARPFNSRKSSVISIQSPGLNESTLSRPVLWTVSWLVGLLATLVAGLIAVTAVITDALSRDPLNVAATGEDVPELLAAPP